MVRNRRFVVTISQGIVIAVAALFTKHKACFRLDGKIRLHRYLDTFA